MREHMRYSFAIGGSNPNTGPRRVQFSLDVLRGTVTATLFRNGIEEVTSGPQVPRGEGNEFEHLSPAFEELQEYKLEVSGNGIFELRRSAAIDAHVFTDADLQSP